MEGPGARRCFCLSKGRDAQLNAGSNAHLREREQLRALRPVALSKRAKAEGADDELVEEALDAADPKPQIEAVRNAERHAIQCPVSQRARRGKKSKKKRNWPCSSFCMAGLARTVCPAAAPLQPVTRGWSCLTRSAGAPARW